MEAAPARARRPAVCNNCKRAPAAATGGQQAGKLKACGGCKSAWYCGKACQTAEWEATHKKECKQLRRAAGAPAGAEGQQNRAPAPAIAAWRGGADVSGSRSTTSCGGGGVGSGNSNEDTLGQPADFTPEEMDKFLMDLAIAQAHPEEATMETLDIGVAQRLMRWRAAQPSWDDDVKNDFADGEAFMVAPRSELDFLKYRLMIGEIQIYPSSKPPFGESCSKTAGSIKTLPNGVAVGHVTRLISPFKGCGISGASLQQTKFNLDIALPDGDDAGGGASAGAAAASPSSQGAASPEMTGSALPPPPQQRQSQQPI